MRGKRGLESPCDALQLDGGLEGGSSRRSVGSTAGTETGSCLRLFVSPRRQEWPGTKGKPRQEGSERGRWEAGSHTGSFLSARKHRCEQGPFAAMLHLAEGMHQQQLEAYTKEASAEAQTKWYLSSTYQNCIETREAGKGGREAQGLLRAACGAARPYLQDRHLRGTGQESRCCGDVDAPSAQCRGQATEAQKQPKTSKYI